MLRCELPQNMTSVSGSKENKQYFSFGATQFTVTHFTLPQCITTFSLLLLILNCFLWNYEKNSTPSAFSQLNYMLIRETNLRAPTAPTVVFHRFPSKLHFHPANNTVWRFVIKFCFYLERGVFSPTPKLPTQTSRPPVCLATRSNPDWRRQPQQQQLGHCWHSFHMHWRKPSQLARNILSTW
jgi:hypothetical protein